MVEREARRPPFSLLDRNRNYSEGEDSEAQIFVLGIEVLGNATWKKVYSKGPSAAISTSVSMCSRCELPPQRERKQDIPLLAGHVLERVARTTGVPRNISDDALKLMRNYDWPGNVREFESCLKRACALTSGPTVHIGDLPTTLQNFHVPEPVVAVNVESSGIRTLAEHEKRAILHAITTLNGDKLEAAKQLGIGKTTLYRKLKEYGSTV